MSAHKSLGNALKSHHNSIHKIIYRLDGNLTILYDDYISHHEVPTISHVVVLLVFWTLTPVLPRIALLT